MKLTEKIQNYKKVKNFEKGNYELTPKGQYFVRYCKKIVDEVWTQKDYIMQYDDQLTTMVHSYNTDHPENKISKREMAGIVIALLQDKYQLD